MVGVIRAPQQVGITVEREVGEPLAEELYALYRRTFAELEHQAVARQLLHGSEFMEEMADGRVHKYVAWDGEGVAVGLATLTSELGAIPWISPAYFARRYPDYWDRRAIYYLGLLMVDTSGRQEQVFWALVRRVVDLMVTERAVLGWDVCGHNEDVRRMGSTLEKMLHRLSDTTVEAVDRQVYYNAIFNGPARG